VRRRCASLLRGGVGSYRIPMEMIAAIVITLILIAIMVKFKCRKNTIVAVVAAFLLLLVGAVVHASGHARRIMRDLESRTTRAVIEEPSVTESNAETTKLTELASAEVSTFFELLKLKRNSIFNNRSCECEGNPHVQLFDEEGPIARLSVHHGGSSLRCALWSGNVDLEDDIIPKIKEYFESLGVNLYY